MRKYNVYLVLAHLCRHKPFRLISDKAFLKINYRAYLSEKLDLEHPTGFNAKLQWLKLYDRNPVYNDLTDKYKVRKYVEKKIGSEYLIPVIGVFESTKDIDIGILPDKFVLKCNHDSASVVICNDKHHFDKKKAFRKLNKAMKKDYFWKGREYNYYAIDRKIIAEQFLQDSHYNDLIDYKFYCFDGEPKFLEIDAGRFGNHICNVYDTDWNLLPVKYGPKSDSSFMKSKPTEFEKMMELACKLSEDIPHVRVDFYLVDGKIYFGELTFHSGGGVVAIEPSSFDKQWGDYINIEQIKL